RRERATSNICTNHSLCALAASVYMTYMGADGLRQVEHVSFKRAHDLTDRLAELLDQQTVLSARQLHDEVQPGRERGCRRPARVYRPAPVPGRGHGPGRALADVAP